MRGSLTRKLMVCSRCKAYSPAETVKAREGKITEAPAIELALKSSPFEGIPHEFDVEDLPSLRKHYKEVHTALPASPPSSSCPST